MIAGCTQRTSACGTCARRDACASLFTRESRSKGGAFLRMLFGEIAKAARKRREGRTNSFRARVEAELEPRLADGPARIGQVARALGCSRQTLYRRLKAEGLTFEQVLDDLRRRRALKLVRDGALAIKDIAYRLGFSDPAAFSRAFKRWTGQSPRTMREAQSG